jgi:hypothetical protein
MAALTQDAMHFGLLLLSLVPMLALGWAGVSLLWKGLTGQTSRGKLPVYARAFQEER